jgi:transposase
MGAYSPLSGDHFELELPECNSTTFQIYLDEFSQYKPCEFKIILLDNGAFHKAQRLIIPDNMALIFLPPYSPELNPAEKIWQKIKRAFTGKLHKNMDELSNFIASEVKSLTAKVIKSTCAFEYLLTCSFWTEIY